jgi:hypothetical protein
MGPIRKQTIEHAKDVRRRNPPIEVRWLCCKIQAWMRVSESSDWPGREAGWGNGRPSQHVFEFLRLQELLATKLTWPELSSTPEKRNKVPINALAIVPRGLKAYEKFSLRSEV